MCFNNASHPSDLHVCSYCFLTIQRLFNHKEQYCRWKGLLKNGAAGVGGIPALMDRNMVTSDTHRSSTPTITTLSLQLDHTETPSHQVVAQLAWHILHTPGPAPIPSLHNLNLQSKPWLGKHITAPHTRWQHSPLGMFPKHLATILSYTLFPHSTL